MDFLTAALLYTIFALFCFGCFWLGQPLLVRVVPKTLLSYIGHVIKWLSAVLLICIPPPVKRGGVTIFTYVFYQRNHIWQSIYVAGTLVCYITAILDGAAFLQATEPEKNHLLLPFTCLFVNTAFFMACSLSNAGEINARSHKFFSETHHYDGVLYKSGTECRTCKLSRPARSKHCGIYNKCIYKFDHYCLWTANAVGGLNHRWFVGYLVSLSVMSAVCIWWMYRALHAVTVVFGLWKLKYAGDDGTPQDMDFPTVCQTLFMQFPRLVFLLAVTILTFFMVAFYAAYHIYLVGTNQTTNERYKVTHFQRHAAQRFDESPYDKGLVENVLDHLFPYRIFSKKSKSK